MSADLSKLVALVPIRSLSGSKTRLGEPLDPEERADLILALLRRTIEAALAAEKLSAVMVVSNDPEALGAARALGADILLQRSVGLNEGLAEARDVVGAAATAMVVLPADLPRIDAAAIDELVARAEATVRDNPDLPVVVLVPDQHGSGTNSLLVSPPAAVAFRFGEGSRAAHADAASAAGAAYVEVAGPLAFDLDTPEDLLAADLGGLGHESGR